MPFFAALHISCIGGLYELEELQTVIFYNSRIIVLFPRFFVFDGKSLYIGKAVYDLQGLLFGKRRAKLLLSRSDGEDENSLCLTGTLCKPPTLRQTPLGRDICDLMLAVNRHYGRSDYLPCICWGSLAREAACWSVGQQLRLEGRVQSRRYLKNTDLGPEERIAYEVSVAVAEPIES